MRSAHLALAGVLVLAGCGGGHHRPTSVAGPTRTTAPPPSVGTVQGQLLHVGGPYGAKSGLWPGTLKVVGPKTHLTVHIGRNGHFSLLLPPGSYRITATSPNYNSGQAACETDPSKTPITADKTVTADIICSLR